ncbi:hypothetical protein P9112_012820 [Eukaryota sp. TZLM1-RC]
MQSPSLRDQRAHLLASVSLDRTNFFRNHRMIPPSRDQSPRYTNSPRSDFSDTFSSFNCSFFSSQRPSTTTSQNMSPRPCPRSVPPSPRPTMSASPRTSNTTPNTSVYHPFRSPSLSAKPHTSTSTSRHLRNSYCTASSPGFTLCNSSPSFPLNCPVDRVDGYNPNTDNQIQSKLLTSHEINEAFLETEYPPCPTTYSASKCLPKSWVQLHRARTARRLAMKEDHNQSFQSINPIDCANSEDFSLETPPASPPCSNFDDSFCASNTSGRGVYVGTINKSDLPYNEDTWLGKEKKESKTRELVSYKEMGSQRNIKPKKSRFGWV